MPYEFKKAELWWFVFVAMVVVVLEAVVTLDPEAAIDWAVWLKAVAIGSVRAGAAALLAFFVKAQTS